MQKYPWRFFKSGRLIQVSLDNGNDLAQLNALDKKLWTVLSAPTKGVRFDARTLEFLDTDHDGRIRVPEVLEAINFLRARLVSLDLLFAPWEGKLALSAINAQTPEGQKLLTSLKHINADKGTPHAAEMTHDALLAIEKEFVSMPFNGDGVICKNAANTPELLALLENIMTCCGGVKDRSGEMGINREKIDQFFADVEHYLLWRAEGHADAAILFLGEATFAVAEAYNAVSTKIDDFFTRCQMAAFDTRAATALNGSEHALLALTEKTLNKALPALAEFPLAAIEPNAALPLNDAVNPYWADVLAAFAQKCAAPILKTQNQTLLTAAQWQQIKNAFAPFNAWQTKQEGANVAAIGEETLKKLAADAALRATLNALIDRDLERDGEHEQLLDAERVMCYVAHLREFLQNYVNQAELYNYKTLSMSQVGTVYIDGRACSLCFHVDNLAQHAALAEKSKCCLIYLDLNRPSDKAKRTVCAVVTFGFAKTLWVGRNGIFIDRDGQDWEATIVKVVSAAVSLREAFWTPWIKLGEFVSAQLQKFLATKEDSAMTQAMKTIETPPVKQPDNGASGAAMASSVAALGIGLGMVGAAFAGIVGMVAGLPLWKVLLGIVCIILLISMPSVIICYFKLRARDLGAILNAGGWAVNRELHFSIPLASGWTQMAAVPSKGYIARDPYAKKNPWLTVIIILLILGAAGFGGWQYYRMHSQPETPPSTASTLTLPDTAQQ